jgi:hypothetical protein
MMKKMLGRLVMTLGLVVLVAPPGWARVATIETTAPLGDHSEASIKAAVTEAVQTALRGAVAMGLSRVHLNHALVLDDAVVIQLLAADADEEALPDESAPEADQPEPGAPHLGEHVL